MSADYYPEVARIALYLSGQQTLIHESIIKRAKAILQKGRQFGIWICRICAQQMELATKLSKKKADA